jgi:hypothetical protein
VPGTGVEGVTRRDRERVRAFVASPPTLPSRHGSAEGQEHEPGGVYHVTARGNNQCPVFVDEGDRLLFVDLLGRYTPTHSWLILAHCLMTTHYVVLNPVRAGLCGSPADWRWSSYRASAGIDVAPSFLAEYELLSLFGRRAARARQA